MGITRDEVELLFRLDELYRFSKDAKRYVWSDDFAEDSQAEGYFSRHPMDSEERLWINEVALYFEYAGVLHEAGLVGRELLERWVPAPLYWRMLAPVLEQARVLLDDQTLWDGFEGLAAALSAET